MIDKIIKNFQEASEVIKEKASNLGQEAKEKSSKLMDDWLGVFPELVSYGFEMTSFSVGFAISPSIDVELKGDPEQFSIERLEELIAQNEGEKTLNYVLASIRSARNLHARMDTDLKSPLILKIKVKITPEIKVYFGTPMIP